MQFIQWWFLYLEVRIISFPFPLYSERTKALLMN